MRSTWPALVAVVAIGTVIGISIGGLPSSRADEVDLPSATTLVRPTDPPIAQPSIPATVVATSAPTTLATTATTAAAEPPVTSPPDTPPPDTSPPVTSPPDTAAPDTAAPDTAVAPLLLDRAAVRVVLANGDGRFNLVGINVDRILPLGYVTVDQTDVSESRRVDRTVIYHREGFDDEARRLAADLLVPDALIEPLGDRTATDADANGDLIAVLGPDAVR